MPLHICRPQLESCLPALKSRTGWKLGRNANSMQAKRDDRVAMAKVSLSWTCNKSFIRFLVFLLLSAETETETET